MLLQNCFHLKRIIPFFEYDKFLCSSLDSRGQVDVIYLDFRKAFNQEDHFAILIKLSKKEFSESLLSLCKCLIDSN